MIHSYAIFSAQYAPHVGGVESFTKNLAHELARAGNAVVVVTSRLDESPEVEVQADGVRIVRLPCHALMAGRLPIARRSTRHRRLLESVASLGIDRVLVNTRFYEHSVDGLDFARRVGAPAIMLDHGSAYLTFGAGGLAGGLVDAAARAHEHLMTRRDLRRTPTFAGISRKSAAWLATFGIATDLVIPNAIDAPAFRAESSGRDFRAEFDVAPAERLVAYVGRLAGEKGPLELAAAARLLGGGYRVLMAGDGVLRAALESDLPNNVCLLGNLGHPDLSALLSQADVFCLPTRSEGFCTSLLEAGAWGVPCVVPDVGGAREVLCPAAPDPAAPEPVTSRSVAPDPAAPKGDAGVRTFGAITRGRTPDEVAAAIRDVCGSWTPERSAALRDHVERTCSWAATVRALESAFERAPGRD